MIISQEISRAIAAHAHWKHRLRLAVAIQRSDLDPGTVRSDRACAFGAWLHALPQAQATRHWKRVEALLAAFHEIAAQVLAAALAGRSGAVEDALALGGEFSQISARLIVALRHWKIAMGTSAAGGPSGEAPYGTRHGARR